MPSSFNRAALYVRSLAASISVSIWVRRHRYQPRHGGMQELDASTDLRELMGHPLLLSDRLAELHALVRVLDRLVERSLREPDHLRSDSDSALVEDLDRNLSSEADVSLCLNILCPVRGVAGSRPTLYPFPISPIKFLPGTTTSSKSSVHVDDARIPS